MGFLEARREKKVLQQYQAALESWQAARDTCAANLELAKTFNGDDRSSTLLLKPGEALFVTITGAGLIEDRRGRGKWHGGSSGVSFPIGSIGGRSVRYHRLDARPLRPGRTDTDGDRRRDPVRHEPASRVPRLEADPRMSFREARRLPAHRDGSTVFSVSNRQKATTVHYGPQVSDWFDLRLDLALAHYRNDLP